jgi:hypothetical protein
MEMDNTYLLCANYNDIIDREVRICSHKLVTDDCSRGGDPRVIPVGLAEILKFVSWM